MQNILNVIQTHYLSFLIITLIIIFILIGFIVDESKPKDKKKKTQFKTIDEVTLHESKVQPSIEKNTNDQFDDPLIK